MIGTVSETTSSFVMRFCCTCRRLRLSDSALTWLASAGVVMKGKETNILRIFQNYLGCAFNFFLDTPALLHCHNAI